MDVIKMYFRKAKINLYVLHYSGESSDNTNYWNTQNSVPLSPPAATSSHHDSYNHTQETPPPTPPEEEDEKDKFKCLYILVEAAIAVQEKEKALEQKKKLALHV